MTDDTANLILEYMRKFERVLGDARDDMHGLRAEMQGINRRLANVEEGVVGVNRRLDRLDERVTRIEKRLDLVEN